jgi:hypothetical protein
VGATAAGGVFLVAFFFVGAVPLLPLFVRPLTRHPNGVPLLQIPAAWLSIRVAFDDENGPSAQR